MQNMSNRKRRPILGRALLSATFGLLPLAASALPTQTWSDQVSPVREITSVSSNGSAAAMNGAQATVFFDDGSSEQAVFAGGPVVGGDISVATMDNAVVVANSEGSLVSFPAFSISNLDRVRTITGFRIDARGDGTGHAAFDRGLGVSDTLRPSTPGSETGIDLHLDFSGRTFLTGSVDITFSNPLSLPGAAPVGDLFGTVEVRMQLGTVIGLPPVTQFSGVFSTIQFNSDVDSVVYAAPVPEPSAAWLLVAGLGVLIGARHRRLPR